MTVQGSFTNAHTPTPARSATPMPHVDLQQHTKLHDTHLASAYIERMKKSFGYILCTTPKDDDRTFRALLPAEHIETPQKLQSFLARYSLKITNDEAHTIRLAMASLPLPSSLTPDPF